MLPLKYGLLNYLFWHNKQCIGHSVIPCYENMVYCESDLIFCDQVKVSLALSRGLVQSNRVSTICFLFLVPRLRYAIVSNCCYIGIYVVMFYDLVMWVVNVSSTNSYKYLEVIDKILLFLSTAASPCDLSLHSIDSSILYFFCCSVVQLFCVLSFHSTY